MKWNVFRFHPKIFPDLSNPDRFSWFSIPFEYCWIIQFQIASVQVLEVHQVSSIFSLKLKFCIHRIHLMCYLCPENYRIGSPTQLSSIIIPYLSSKAFPSFHRSYLSSFSDEEITRVPTTKANNPVQNEQIFGHAMDLINIATVNERLFAQSYKNNFLPERIFYQRRGEFIWWKSAT